MPNTPPTQENNESVNKVLTNEALLKAFDDTSYKRGYAAGRSSMKSDILAVMPEEKICCANKNDGSAHEIACDGFNACRSQLLDNMKGIV